MPVNKQLNLVSLLVLLCLALLYLLLHVVDQPCELIVLMLWYLKIIDVRESGIQYVCSAPLPRHKCNDLVLYIL